MPSSSATSRPVRATAVIVGSGPNGLAAAITLAEAGLHVTILERASEIGGGTRTAELTLPGYLHDVCSAAHPLGVASPFFLGVPLERYGLRWITPDVQVAHPLEDGTAAACYRSIERTAAELGEDGPAWATDIGGIARRWERLGPSLLGPLTRFPRNPLGLARFGLKASLPATAYASRRFSRPATQALFTGIAAHSILPLTKPLTASFGFLLGALAHVGGWPIAAGGSASIARALAAHLEEMGGEIVLNHDVRSTADLPEAEIVVFDTSPRAVASVYGTELPSAARRRYRRFRHGPASFKVDLAVSAPIPWAAEVARSAGTVHVGGTWKQIANAEAGVWHDVHPEKPFVLVAQQSVHDSTRTPDDGHTVWAYCHVPHGSDVDMTEPIVQQIERFAPGFSSTIRATSKMSSADWERYNPNYVGGDIGGGAYDGLQLLARGGLSPYRTGLAGVYICSASTPPGAGVHGMCGLHAARRALADLRSSH
jgi:phytoene dehydrogenase-like protein